MNTFSKDETIAIYKVAYQMVLADGKIMPEEMVTVEEAMKKMGIHSIDEVSLIKEKASLLQEDKCLLTLELLNQEQKRFVSSLLGTISSSDGDIDDRELELWRELCDKCNLPYMNNRQAILIFKTF